MRPLNATVAQPLQGTDGAQFPFWSPDSQSIGFFAAGKLKRIDAGRGTLQILADASTARGGAWNADGTILFSSSSVGLIRVTSTGGTPVETTHQQSGTNHRFPTFLPDGRHFLFYVIDRARMTRFTFDAAEDVFAVWSPNWKEPYYLAPDGNLMAVPIRTDGGTIQAGAPSVLFKPAIWGGGSNFDNRTQYDVAPDGRFPINVSVGDNVSPITLVLNWNPRTN